MPRDPLYLMGYLIVFVILLVILFRLVLPALGV